jgi:hypothetical protein
VLLEALYKRSASLEGKNIRAAKQLKAEQERGIVEDGGINRENLSTLLEREDTLDERKDAKKFILGRSVCVKGIRYE